MGPLRSFTSPPYILINVRLMHGQCRKVALGGLRSSGHPVHPSSFSTGHLRPPTPKSQVDLPLPTYLGGASMARGPVQVHHPPLVEAGCASATVSWGSPQRWCRPPLLTHTNNGPGGRGHWRMRWQQCLRKRREPGLNATQSLGAASQGTSAATRSAMEGVRGSCRGGESASALPYVDSDKIQ